MRGPSLRPQESRPSPARPDDLRPRQSRLEYAFELVLAAVSHGLASSPPRGEGAHRRYRRSLHYCSSMPGGTLVVRTAPTWRIARAGGVRKPRDYDMAARCPHVQELQVRRITGKGCIHGSAVARISLERTLRNRVFSQPGGIQMKSKLLIGAAGGAALMLAGSSVAAQPSMNGAANVLGSVARIQSDVEQVAYRNCWWRHGVRHCRYYRGARSYGYSGPHLPEAYRTGSSRWWQEMDRQDRGGRGRR